MNRTDTAPRVLALLAAEGGENGRTIREVAEALGISRACAKSAVHRLRPKLLRRIDELGYARWIAK